MHLISLSTDFGGRDWFVGTMKGVILGLDPEAKIVDLTHGIPAGDIHAGALAFAAGCRFFPKRTVHIVVVDPGVGSARKALAVQTAAYFFVGPDNGVLSLALAWERILAIHALENEDYFLRPVSRTFHGRDVFAPVAAHLSRGVAIEKLGPAQRDYVRLPWPEPRKRPGQIEGQVVYIDHFGNGITSLDNGLATGLVRVSCEVHAKRRWLCPLKEFYQAVPLKAAVVIAGSSGFLEIAVNGGSAERLLGLSIGTRVVLRSRGRER